MPPGRRALPGRAHRMGAILDHRQARGVADRHQPVHVADMAAHVAEQERLRARRLGGKVVHVDGQRLGRLEEDRLGPHRRDGARNGGEREGVGQHPVARPDAKRPQGAAERVAARGHRKAVFRAGEGGEFLLQERGFRDLALGGVVAVEPSVPQDVQRGRDPGLGDRLLLGEAAGESFHARRLAAPHGKVNRRTLDKPRRRWPVPRLWNRRRRWPPGM